MIKSIDISNFGCFKDFVWSDSVRHQNNDPSDFKKLNILYGRNYSGKTTLSRIFRSLQTGILPKNYEAPLFTVSTSLGDISQIQIPSADHEIRVYNKDFVDEHLEFLKDPDGEIAPFAIIGSENKAVEQKIREKTKILGSEEDKEGLRHEAATKSSEYSIKKNARDLATSNLKTKLTNKATRPPGGIKHNTVYRDPNYNTPKIEADIKTIRSKSLTVLPEAERVAREALLTEVSLPDIPKKLAFKSSMDDLFRDTAALISKKITPTQPIQDLLDDAVLQAWVKSGVPLHRDDRADCGFCGQPLPPDLWKKLDEHFSKESADLEVALQTQLSAIESEKEILKSVTTVDSNDFYSTIQKLFNDAHATLSVEIDNYMEELDNLANAINARAADIFTQESAPSRNDNSVAFGKALSQINCLIEKNNAKTKTLAEDQAAARTELRLSEISQFIQDIDLQKEEESLAGLNQEVDALKSESEDLQTRLRELEDEIDSLRIQLKDERKGADKVNQYLNHYFGHGALRLDAIEDTESSAFHFRILRGDDPAYNLSEGECSLVAFCYFMAKLEDTDSTNKKLVIYIDDPVSSLDNNHIFFVFSLIEAILAAPEEDTDGNKIVGADNKPIFRYEQLFICTHNLEFLKYLKRLSRPKKDNEHFLLMAKDGRSDFGLMPDYLRNYVTEFNFLFGEIYTCSDAKNATTHHHCFYSFGNNLRKFLEAYLFFKYPAATGDSSVTTRVKTFFRNGPGTDVLVQRITNEFSHLAEMPDRGVQPIDYGEIAKLAAFVLKKIKDSDGEQFSCFLQSIGKPDPFAT